jgi:hypothetical protein
MRELSWLDPRALDERVEIVSTDPVRLTLRRPGLLGR